MSNIKKKKKKEIENMELPVPHLELPLFEFTFDHHTAKLQRICKTFLLLIY